MKARKDTYSNVVAKACRQHDPALYQLVKDLDPSGVLNLMKSLIVAAASDQQWPAIVRKKKPQEHHKPDYFDYWRMALEEIHPQGPEKDVDGVFAANRARQTFELINDIQPKETLMIPEEIFLNLALYAFSSLSKTEPASKKELWIQFLELEENGFVFKSSSTSMYAEPLRKVIEVSCSNGIAFDNVLLFIEGVKESKVYKRYRNGEWVIKHIVKQFVSTEWTSANDLASLILIGSSYMSIASNRLIERGSLDKLTRDCKRAVEGVTADFIP